MIDEYTHLLNEPIQIPNSLVAELEILFPGIDHVLTSNLLSLELYLYKHHPTLSQDKLHLFDRVRHQLDELALERIAVSY